MRDDDGIRDDIHEGIYWSVVVIVVVVVIVGAVLLWVGWSDVVKWISG